MQTILSSAPDAKYFPFGENRTVCMVPEWLLIDANCFGLFAASGSSVLQIASVDQIRTYPSVHQRVSNAPVRLHLPCTFPQGWSGLRRAKNVEKLTSGGRHETASIGRNIATIDFKIFPLAYSPKKRCVISGRFFSSRLLAELL